MNPCPYKSGDIVAYSQNPMNPEGTYEIEGDCFTDIIDGQEVWVCNLKGVLGAVEVDRIRLLKHSTQK